jgi:hypothetical protein
LYPSHFDLAEKSKISLPQLISGSKLPIPSRLAHQHPHPSSPCPNSLDAPTSLLQRLDTAVAKHGSDQDTYLAMMDTLNDVRDAVHEHGSQSIVEAEYVLIRYCIVCFTISTLSYFQFDVCSARRFSFPTSSSFALSFTVTLCLFFNFHFDLPLASRSPLFIYFLASL